MTQRLYNEKDKIPPILVIALSLYSKNNTRPVEGVLFILQIGTLLQIALVLVYLMNLLITHVPVGNELSPVITLVVSLVAVSMLIFLPKGQVWLKRAFLPVHHLAHYG